MLSFVKLDAVPDRSGFACGTPELDLYFKTQAGQDVRRQLSAVFVMLEDESVAGYYTLSQSALTVEAFPREIAKKLPPKMDIACTLLGRFAVDRTYQGRGFGQLLLFHALKKAAQASEEVASFAVVVKAKDDKAVAFYRKYGFLSLEDIPLLLFIPMKAVKAMTQISG